MLRDSPDQSLDRGHIKALPETKPQKTQKAVNSNETFHPFSAPCSECTAHLRIGGQPHAHLAESI